MKTFDSFGKDYREGLIRHLRESVAKLISGSRKTGKPRAVDVKPMQDTGAASFLAALNSNFFDKEATEDDTASSTSSTASVLTCSSTEVEEEDESVESEEV